MKLPLAWLREFVDVPDQPATVADRFGACGFAVEEVTDQVIDLEITANRPDCLGVLGLAREASAAFDLDLRPPRIDEAVQAVKGQAALNVSVADAGCGRYALAVVDVRVGPSPDWLAAHLRAAGVRPINNVVDVTNFVMLELGHPLHAFDAARLRGPEIHVRRARAGETIVTLDGERRTLDDTMLVIADHEQPVAVAGVMGGAESEVSAATSRIALESAWFLPPAVRATSRKLGLKTEAAARFERGADLAMPVLALRRALTLLHEIGAGRLVGGVTDISPRSPEARAVDLRRARLARLLGTTVPDGDVRRILTRLGFGVHDTAEGWRLDVPTFRVDVSREADLIEEVGRHWGFDRITPTLPTLDAWPPPPRSALDRDRTVRRLLCGAGLQEAMTFTFIERASAAPFAPDDQIMALKNPLSEKFAVLRPSLVPGLLESLIYNRHRQAVDIRLFELGATFSRTGGERRAVGWVLSGSRGTHWSGDAGPLTLSDAKGVAELLGGAFRVTLTARAVDDCPWLTPGQAAELTTDAGQVAGWVGRLASTRGIDDPVYAGELGLDVLTTASAGPLPIDPLPRQPSIVRDISIVIDERLPAATVRGTIRSAAPATLVAVAEFDRYQGTGVPAGQVSLSLRLTFQDAARTLTDAEAHAAVDAIVAALRREHGAVLRGR
jgi:phenylalanyl-tRNA synthetase beta chain